MGLLPTSAMAPPAAPAAKPPGLLQRIGQNPMQAQLMLMGLGLLGSKRQSQAAPYLSGITSAFQGLAQKPLQQAQIENLGADTAYKTAQAGAEGQPAGYFEEGGAELNALRALSTLSAKLNRGEQLTVQERQVMGAAQAYLSRQRTTFGPGGQPMIQAPMNMDWMNGQPGQPQPGQDPAQGQPPQVPMPGQVPAPGQVPGATTATGTPQQYPQTAGEVAVDKAMADEYVNWTTGGYADVEKSMTQLYSALGALESGSVQTGDWKAMASSLLPDKWVSFLRPDFMDNREKVEEVAQRNLRLILGAQFAEREGEKLIARAYNPNLETEQNAERVRRLAKQISDAAAAKQKAMDYFGKEGTMRGYAPGINSFEDLQAQMESDFLAGVYEGAEDAKEKIPAEGIFYDPETGTWSDQ